MAFALSEENEARLEALLKRYPTEHRMAALIPTLYLVQDQEGFVSLDGMRYVAGRLELPPSQVLNTATFYTLFRKEKLGKHHIQVCSNVPCWLRGSDHLLEVIRDRCGIGPGEVSDDRVFSCEEVQCLAACGTAPAAQINWDYHEGLSAEAFGALLDELGAAEGREVMPAAEEATVEEAPAAEEAADEASDEAADEAETSSSEGADDTDEVDAEPAEESA